MKFKHKLDEHFPIRELTLGEIPKQLFQIPQPPKKLFIRGELPSAETKLLCVVGSRKYTSYGRDVCQKLIAGLRGYNIAIVSGLAMGIDGLAHEAAIEAGLITIAMPGSGLAADCIHPVAHLGLARKILESGGCLISEFEPNFKATAYSFPQRNRLAAGLSQAVLIIEGEVKSGTLITARLATEYNKDVLTIPGSIFSKTSEGPHLLLRLGATPITTSEEILLALGIEPKNSDPKNLELEYDDCSEPEKKILTILREPMSKDDLLEQLGLPVSEANTLLTVLELKGLIYESLGEIRLK